LKLKEVILKLFDIIKSYTESRVKEASKNSTN